MKNILLRIHTFFIRLPIVWFILIILPLNYLISFIIVYPLKELFLHDEVYIPLMKNQFPYWLLLIILIPFAYIETIINQWLVFKILRYLIRYKNKNIIIVIISAFIFSILHNYNLSYMFNTFIAGLIFAYSFLVAEEKKLSPVLVLTIIHYLNNVIVFALIYAFL